MLSLLAASSLAVLATALGVLPLLAGRQPTHRGLAMAYSIAGGVMIGLSYLLTLEGLERHPSVCLLGAVAAASYFFWIQRKTEVNDLDTSGPARSPKPVTARYLFHSGLHSSAEGAAIGAAAAASLALGIFLTLALAAHNIGEGLVLAHRLPALSKTSASPAVLAVTTKFPQTLLAIGTFLLLRDWPEYLPLALGFAAGALFFLTLTDLAPFAYRHGRREWVAFLFSAAAALVVLTQDYFL